VPGVDRCLQALALGQQRGVLRGEVGHERVKTLPEGIGCDAGAGQHLGVDELIKLVGHLKAVGASACGHGKPLESKQAVTRHADRDIDFIANKLLHK